MKPNSTLAIVCLGLALSIASPSTADTEKLEADAITEISLQRTYCLGLCPDDEIDLHSDQKASYIGKSSVKQIGVFTGIVYSENFKRLAEFLIAQHFFGMENVRSNGPPETDGTFITVVRGDEVKTLNLFETAPLEQWIIAKAIQGVASDIDWRKHTAGVRGYLFTKPAVAATVESSHIQQDAKLPDKPRLAKTLVCIQRYVGVHPIVQVGTDEKGHFEIELPPGSYYMFADVADRGTGYHTEGEPQKFIVQANTFTHVDNEFKPKPKKK